MVSALEATKDPSLVAIVGAASSSVSRAVQQVASIFEIPQISYSSTASPLSNKILYPYFFRVVAPDSLQGSALASIVHSIGWRKAATMYSNDDYGLSGVTAFAQRASDVGVSIEANIPFAPGAIEYGVALDQLVKHHGVHVVFLNCLVSDAVELFKEADRRGLLDGQYVWVGTDGWLQDELLNVGLPSSKLIGVLGLRPALPSGVRLEAFLDSWEQLNATEFAGAGDRTVNVFATYAYDALYQVARTIDAMIRGKANALDGSELRAWLSNSSYEGTTGLISFDENFDRIAAYSLVNYRGGAGFEIVGRWLAEQRLELDRPILYYGNTTSPPYLPSPMASPSTSSISAGLIGVIAGMSACVCLGFGILVVHNLRRRKHVAALQRENQQLDREARALNSRLNELAKETHASGSSTPPTMDLPINQVMSLLTSIRASTQDSDMMAKLDKAIESIQSNMLFQPSTAMFPDGEGNDDVKNFVQGTILTNVPMPSSSLQRSGAGLQTYGNGSATSLTPTPNLAVTVAMPIPAELGDVLGKLRTLAFDAEALVAKDTTPLQTVFMAVCTQNALLSQLRLDPVIVRDVMLALDRYTPRLNAYHNAQRAANMVQFVHYVLSVTDLYSLLSPRDTFAVLFAAAIKNVDHPGFNASFLVRTRHKLALLYSNQAVLEMHHLAVSMQLVFERFKLFDQLLEEDITALHHTIVDLVLASDMQKHVEVTSRFSLLIDPTEPSKRTAWKAAVATDNGFRNLVLKMVLKLADLSDAARPTKIARGLALRSMIESSLQGVQEAAAGIEVSPFMDGAMSSVAKSQEGIIRFVTLPMFSAFAEVFTLTEVLQNLSDNMLFWQRVVPSTLQPFYDALLASHAATAESIQPGSSAALVSAQKSPLSSPGTGAAITAPRPSQSEASPSLPTPATPAPASASIASAGGAEP